MVDAPYGNASLIACSENTDMMRLTTSFGGTVPRVLRATVASSAETEWTFMFEDMDLWLTGEEGGGEGGRVLVMDC